MTIDSLNTTATPPAEPELLNEWVTICAAAKIQPERGVAALFNGKPVAIFKILGHAGAAVTYYAVDHIDPRTSSPTIARGIVGSSGGEPVVIAPLLKDRFSLATGRCLNDGDLSLGTYDVHELDGVVQVRENVTTTKSS